MRSDQIQVIFKSYIETVIFYLKEPVRVPNLHSEAGFALRSPCFNSLVEPVFFPPFEIVKSVPVIFFCSSLTLKTLH